MEWLKITTSTEMVRVRTDEIVYVKADGKDYAFYRDKEGKRHDIHNPADYPHKKWAGIIPWLVFRKSQ